MLALIPLLPFLGFVVNAFIGRRLSRTVSGGIACAVMLGSFAVSLAAVWAMLQQPGEARAHRALAAGMLPRN